MPYAHRPDIYDADTHMMERADWIAEFADADIRERLEPFVGGRKQALAVVDHALEAFQGRRADPDVHRPVMALCPRELTACVGGLVSRSEFELSNGPVGQGNGAVPVTRSSGKIG